MEGIIGSNFYQLIDREHNPNWLTCLSIYNNDKKLLYQQCGARIGESLWTATTITGHLARGRHQDGSDGKNPTYIFGDHSQPFQSLHAGGEYSLTIRATESCRLSMIYDITWRVVFQSSEYEGCQISELVSQKCCPKVRGATKRRYIVSKKKKKFLKEIHTMSRLVMIHTDDATQQTMYLREFSFYTRSLTEYLFRFLVNVIYSL